MSYCHSDFLSLGLALGSPCEVAQQVLQVFAAPLDSSEGAYGFWYQAPRMAKRFRGNKFSSQTLQFDGMEFTNVTFQGVTFTYSGGAFSFRKVTFSLPLTVRLEDSSPNTAALIDLIRSLNSGDRRLSPSEGVPIVRETGT